MVVTAKLGAGLLCALCTVLMLVVWWKGWFKSGKDLPKLKNGKACEGQRIQVFMDVDDTFKSSAGHFPSGCDNSYGKGVVYPGFSQFILEIARTASENTKVMRPAAMSARPDEAKAILAMKQDSPEGQAVSVKPVTPDVPDAYDMVNADMPLLGASGVQAYDYQNPNETLGNWSLNVDGSMYGTLQDGVSHKNMGYTKLDNFEAYFQKPDALDTCVVFIGDDGQGDCNPGAQNMANYPKRGTEHGLKAAFIHVLPTDDPDNGPACTANRPCSHLSGTAPIFKFDTYLEAAQKALKANLISEDGYLRVERSVRSFFDKYCVYNHSWRPNSSPHALTHGARSSFPDIITNGGCHQLRSAVVKAGKDRQHKLDELDIDSRSLERIEGFCRTCCNADGTRTNSSGKPSFNLSWYQTGFGYGFDASFQCSEIYAPMSSSNFMSGSSASDNDCKEKCSKAIPYAPTAALALAEQANIDEEELSPSGFSAPAFVGGGIIGSLAMLMVLRTFPRQFGTLEPLRAQW